MLLALLMTACSGEDAPPASPSALVPFDSVFVLQQRIPLRIPADSPIGLPIAIAEWREDFAIIDQLQAEIRIFNKAGRPTRSIGRPGDGPGEFRRPIAAAVVGDDLAILDAARGVVSTFDPNGRYISSWSATVIQPRSLSEAPAAGGLLLAGQITTLDSNAAPLSLHLFSVDGKRLKSFAPNAQPTQRYQANFNAMTAAVVGSVVLAVRNSSNRVDQYDFVGRPVRSAVVGAPLYRPPAWPKDRLSGPGGEQAQVTKWANDQTWTLGILALDSTRYVTAFSTYDVAAAERVLYYSVAAVGGGKVITTSPTNVVLKAVSRGRVLGMVMSETGSIELQIYRVSTNQ